MRLFASLPLTVSEFIALLCRFFDQQGDFSDADLLIVAGTSLKVAPFNTLVTKVCKSAAVRPTEHIRLLPADLPYCGRSPIPDWLCQVHDSCWRVLINRDEVGKREGGPPAPGSKPRSTPFSVAAPVCLRFTRRVCVLLAASFFADFDPLASKGFRFGDWDNTRDVFVKGDCDAGVWQLCELLGWTEDLQKLIKAGPVPLAKQQEEKVDSACGESSSCATM